MPYELPPLPYDYNALEPTIDEQTMRIHHGKHHQAYVDNLNKALDGTEWDGRPLEQVLALLDELPEDKRAAVRNNGGGHANHSLFWQVMKPGGGGEPSDALANGDQRRCGRHRPAEGGDERRRREALRLGLELARLGRHRAHGRLDPESGHAPDERSRAAPRHRRVGARVLPQLSEPATGLPERLVERRQLGRSRDAATKQRAGAEPSARRFAASVRRAACRRPWC